MLSKILFVVVFWLILLYIEIKHLLPSPWHPSLTHNMSSSRDSFTWAAERDYHVIKVQGLVSYWTELCSLLHDFFGYTYQCVHRRTRRGGGGGSRGAATPPYIFFSDGHFGPENQVIFGQNHLIFGQVMERIFRQETSAPSNETGPVRLCQ